MSYSFDQSFRDQTLRGVRDSQSAPRAFTLNRPAPDAIAVAQERVDKQELTFEISHMRGELVGANDRMRALIGRMEGLTSHLNRLLGEARGRSIALNGLIAQCNSLLRQAESFRDSAEGKEASARDLEKGLSTVRRTIDATRGRLLDNGQEQAWLNMEMQTIQALMTSLQGVIAGLTAEINALLSKARA